MGDDVVLSYQNSLLRKSDVDLLRSPCWLNDQIIGFWFEYLENKPDVNSSVCLIGPEVTQLIKLGSREDTSLLLGSLDLNSKRLILLPVNDEMSAQQAGGTHWSLLVFDCMKNQFFHMDSISGGNYSHAKQVAKNMFKEVHEVTELKCTQQKNSWDCGVFVCCHAEHLVNLCSEGNFDQPATIPLLDMETVKQYRGHMLEIIKKLSNNI